MITMYPSKEEKGTMCRLIKDWRVNRSGGGPVQGAEELCMHPQGLWLQRFQHLTLLLAHGGWELISHYEDGLHSNITKWDPDPD